MVLKDLASNVSRAGSGVSTTYLGVIVAGIMSIGRMAGVDLIEQDVANVVTLAALTLIVIGRARAKGPAKWWTAIFGNDGSHAERNGQSDCASRSAITNALLCALGASALLAFMSASGCAALQGRTNVALYEMAGTYINLHEDYVAAYEASDEAGRDWMRHKVAPAMDRARDALDAALTAAIAGQEVQSGELSGVKVALTEAALAIADMILFLGGK
ncbi:hypothetical protein DPQ33_08780 [Oceanidesulfovibrio indonesiensis]|uniref:Uncharacterized protein n=1 Tax=Oceanidesulfovibrio indonesiensis TaxID=54767 RepID=A0A7M3MG41_9BACT|nr:hypothetical protein [Oceanidesulfovibrio indonesiensis]TVM17718.1 hypothetical protein DPQ33_08780 [Oceanidesulfovibrio indonesiensis]